MTESNTPRRDALSWVALAVAVVGLAIVVLALTTRWDAIVHGHPAFAILLAITAVGCVLGGVIALRRRSGRSGRGALVGRALLLVLAAGWIAAVAWLQPYPATEPALSAMASDAAVTVTETPTGILLAPTDGVADTGVLFQPGALVDARAYVAVLRPLAEAGFTVVIPKQPLGIAFLSLGALDEARSQHPEIEDWIVGGHSLGGTVAAFEADETAAPGAAPVIGLLLFASYPAGDMSEAEIAVLSISGSEDGLATPAKIEASRAELPPGSEFVVIDGASHAQFGAYGSQSGDGVASIGAEVAREQIATASLAFAESLAR